MTTIVQVLLAEPATPAKVATPVSPAAKKAEAKRRLSLTRRHQE